MKSRATKITLLCAALSLFLTAYAFGEIKLKAEVKKTNITMDETIAYNIIITATQKDIGTPKLPEFKDFEIISQTQSSRISFAEGQMKTALSYIFILAPKKTGKLEIGPSQIKVKGLTYTSRKFEIEVVPGEKQLEQEEPALPPESLQESEQVTI